MAFLSYIECASCITILTRLFLTLLGTGAVYSFDPVGSYEREACRAAGAAQSLVQPFLDNQVSTSFLISRTNRICEPCNSFLCLLGQSDPSPISYRVWCQQIHPAIHPLFIPFLLPFFPIYGRWRRKYLLTDLLQEPNACSRNLISQTSAIVHRAAPRDRLIHKCDRKTHWGLFAVYFPVDLDRANISVFSPIFPDTFPVVDYFTLHNYSCVLGFTIRSSFFSCAIAAAVPRAHAPFPLS